MRDDYVKTHGFKKYMEAQGLKIPEGKPLVDDHSKTTNLGLINIKSKNETENMNHFMGLGLKEIMEIVLAILVILYATRVVVKYLKNKKQQKAAEKKGRRSVDEFETDDEV